MGDVGFKFEREQLAVGAYETHDQLAVTLADSVGKLRKLVIA